MKCDSSSRLDQSLMIYIYIYIYIYIIYVMYHVSALREKFWMSKEYWSEISK